MRITDEEIEKWHQHVWFRSEAYKRVLKDILVGVPTINGMASPYRQLKRKEIVERIREVLNRWEN